VPGEGLVEDHYGLLERHCAGDVEQGQGHRRPEDAADVRDVVRAERGGVQMDPWVDASTGTATVAVGVHAAQRHVPNGQAMQERGRHVADHRVGRELVQRGVHREKVLGLGLGG